MFHSVHVSLLTIMWLSVCCLQTLLESGCCCRQGDGVTFDFPDLFGGKQTSLEKTISMSKQNDRVIEEGHRKQWDRLSVPPWFR